MKALKLILLLTITLTFSKQANSQLSDIINSVLSDEVAWKPGNAVTTSIRDAYTIVNEIPDVKGKEPKPVLNYNDLKFGFYRDTIQTYCLHPGTYEPTSGSGYLLAPLKGSRESVIRTILRKSVYHPEVSQSEVQSLIWSIMSGAKYSNFQDEYKRKISPLLDWDDIAMLDLDLSKLYEIAPTQVTDALQVYSDLRNNASNPLLNFEVLERIAVLRGIAPIGPGSRLIEPGNWNYMNNGYYVRTYPHGYSRTVIEIYKPYSFTITKDKSGRIISVTREDGLKIETEYFNETSKDFAIVNDNPVPVWRFKNIKFTGVDTQTKLSIESKGWITQDVSKKKSKIETASLNNLPAYPTSTEYSQRIKTGKAKDLKLVSKTLGIEKVRKHSKKVKKDWKNFNNWLKGIYGTKDGFNNEELDNFLEQFERLDLYFCEQYLNKSFKNKFDPTSFVSTPGNTYMQRVGLSVRKFR